MFRAPLAVVATACLTLLVAGAASASLAPPDGGGGGGGTRVHRLKPWKARYLYRVQAPFALRNEQSRDAGGTGVSIATGEWLHIECQRMVDTPSGAELWLKVAGGWAPDSVMKTYTDSRLKGSPTCRRPHPNHVWVDKRWRKTYRYRITEAQSPQRIPQLGNGLGTIVEAGQWARITCQVVGQSVRGSRLWDRIGPGGYIPDSTVKTYTDGRIQGAPRCKNVKLPPPKYVALGDSYSSGLGGDGHWAASNPQALEFSYDYLAGEPPGRDKDCYRNRHAYGPRLAGRQKVHRRFVFLACQGDQTSDVLSKQIPAMPANTQLVTMTIGGNDVGFSSVVEACVTVGRDCAGAVYDRFGKDGSKVAGELGAKLDQVYWQLRAKAPYATVIVIGYPQLFVPAKNISGCGALDAGDARLLNSAGRVLNSVIRQAVQRHQDFRYVSLDGVFRGHGMCQDLGPRMWINPITIAGNRKIFSAHPNLRGQQAIAQTVRRAAPDIFD